MLARILTLALISASTAGCATNAAFKSDCDWARPILPSREDVLTRETKEQIVAHNETGERLCKWKP